MKKFTILLFLIFLIGMFNLSCLYAQENIDNQDKLIEALKNDDETVRGKALDELFSESSVFVENIIKDYMSEKSMNDENKQMKNLILMILAKVTESSTEPIKSSVKDFLNQKENREMYAPIIVSFVQFLKEVSLYKKNTNPIQDPNSLPVPVR